MPRSLQLVVGSYAEPNGSSPHLSNPNYLKPHHSYYPPHLGLHFPSGIFSAGLPSNGVCVNFSQYVCRVSRPSNLVWFGPYTTCIHVHVSITCGLPIHTYQVWLCLR